MIAAVLRETFPGEKRVALIPAGATRLISAGMEVFFERGAGILAGFPDSAYLEAGAKIVGSRAEAFAADVVLQVRALGAQPDDAGEDLEQLHQGVTLIAMCDPLYRPDLIASAASSGATLFALELVPRISRAQAMDVLSSMATVAGYRAVLLAALELPKLFPMLTTAAGTITPAKALVIGAGVAGLQAIATARRLGAMVTGYDLRPTTRTQIESLGAKFLEVPVEAAAEDRQGYAQGQNEAFYRRQQEVLSAAVAQSDVVITTAAVPGKRSPLLIPASAVEQMKGGSVIVDLAAERGGNCAVTVADHRVVHHGVTVLGPTNLPGEVPTDASRMFSNNVLALLLHLYRDGKLQIDPEDEITRETMAAHGGEVTNARLRELLVQPAAAMEPAAATETNAAAERASEKSAEKKSETKGGQP